MLILVLFAVDFGAAQTNVTNLVQNPNFEIDAKLCQIDPCYLNTTILAQAMSPWIVAGDVRLYNVLSYNVSLGLGNFSALTWRDPLDQNKNTLTQRIFNTQAGSTYTLTITRKTLKACEFNLEPRIKDRIRIGDSIKIGSDGLQKFDIEITTATSTWVTMSFDFVATNVFTDIEFSSISLPPVKSQKQYSCVHLIDNVFVGFKSLPPRGITKTAIIVITYCVVFIFIIFFKATRLYLWRKYQESKISVSVRNSVRRKAPEIKFNNSSVGGASGINDFELESGVGRVNGKLDVFSEIHETDIRSAESKGTKGIQVISTNLGTSETGK